MDKLQYDNLYKFLVSLGVVLIALPISALIFLTNGTFPTISQSEYEALSEYSIQNLQQRQFIISLIINFLPILSIILCIIGAILIIVGLRKWYQIQKILDSQTTAETKIKEFEVAKMSNVEMITEKIRESEEISNNVVDSSNNDTTRPASSYSKEHQRLLKYAEIEDKFFEHGIPKYMKKRYIYKRNLRIGKFSYDTVAISLKTSTDIIYEVKYWDRKPQNDLVHQTLKRLHSSGVNYEKEKLRDYRCILAIVVPQQIIDDVIEQVELFIEKFPEFNFSDININYVTEESLTNLD